MLVVKAIVIALCKREQPLPDNNNGTPPVSLGSAIAAASGVAHCHFAVAACRLRSMAHRGKPMKIGMECITPGPHTRDARRLQIARGAALPGFRGAFFFDENLRDRHNAPVFFCRAHVFFLGNKRRMILRYLHTMVRVSDLDAALDFYCAKLGLVETRRQASEKGRFTLVFLAAPDDLENAAAEKSAAQRPMIELTYNWDKEEYSGGRNFGHLAYGVSDIYALCAKLMAAGVTIYRPPRDGHMAFIRSPDGISIELLQQGDRLPPREPWVSMKNNGSW